MKIRRGNLPGKLAQAASILAFSLAAFSRVSNAGIADQVGLSPFWNWKTIETEHFRVTFPANLADTAQKEANYLEEAHSVLSPKLYWKPWYKTQILVIDNADLANGLTSAQLRLGLILWVTPPDPWYSTAYYDDWLRLLAFHEYTHMLNMDNVQDIYVPLRILTGDALLPNTAWPTWMLEGLAVYMETRFTHGGRGRSPFYEMLLRTAVDENAFDTSDFYKIDQINGSTPYNPAGEAYYLFGYQLMNQIAHTPVIGGRTADGLSELRDGEDALGVMSLRSASRFPYFINGNLENIIGKDWYGIWEKFAAETRERASHQLARIRSRPVTELERLTPSDGVETIGPAPSPDGTWLAYTSDTPDRRSGLYLMDVISGRTRRVDDKASGATSAFTPDSRTVIYSAVERYHNYYQFSELLAFDLKRGHSYDITHGLRARDPDVSPDGKWLVFTMTENQTTGLAMATLEREGTDGAYRLGEIHRLSSAASKYDRVSAPRFSRDGKRIIYSVHHNGKMSEELMSWDIATASAAVLVDNGKLNRYPATAKDGSIYFISDLSGVDNLYRLPAGAKPGTPPELFSNVTSGLATPAVGPSGEIYAAAYASHGWSIARVPPLKAAVNPQDVTIDPPPAPQADAQSQDNSKHEQFPIKNYSAFPSIWPREWLIAPQIYPGGVYLQSQIAGFDAVDRQEYTAGLGYNTQIPKLDWSALYSNRMLGPILSFAGADSTMTYSVNDQGVTYYARRAQYLAELSYPINWTYSSLVPAISVGGERIYDYLRGYDPDNGDLVGSSPFVPTADFSFTFSNAESSRLGVTPEEGRTLTAGVRVYSDSASNMTTWKGVIKESEYFRILDHAVLSPTIKGMWSSNFDYNFGDADAEVLGRTPSLALIPLNGVFDPLLVRGYPQTVFYSRSASVGTLDFRLPLKQIFRGWGTNPVFLDNLTGFVFGEAAYFPSAQNVPVLPAAGGGLTLATELLTMPVSVTLECDQGFRDEYGGKTDLYILFNLGSIQF